MPTKKKTETTATKPTKTRTTKPVRATAPTEASTATATVAAPKVASVTVTMAPEAPVAPAAPTATAPLTIGQFQKRLYELGFYGGHWDGHYGALTKQGVARFQASKGLVADGEPTPATLAALGF